MPEVLEMKPAVGHWVRVTGDPFLWRIRTIDGRVVRLVDSFGARALVDADELRPADAPAFRRPGWATDRCIPTR